VKIKDEKLNHGIDLIYYEIENNSFGVVYEVTPLDAESFEGCENSQYFAIKDFVESVPEGAIVKVHYKSELVFDSKEEELRPEFLEEGYRKKNIYISINFKAPIIPFFPKAYEKKKKSTLEKLNRNISFESLQSQGMVIENVDPRVCPFFDKKRNQIRLHEDVLHDQNTNEYINVLKLEKLSGGDRDDEIEFSSLRKILKDLHYDSELVTTLTKLNSSVSEGDLKIQLNAKKDIKTKSDWRVQEAKEETLHDIELHGESIFKIDVCILLRGKNKEYIIEEGNRLLSKLRTVGVFNKQNEISLIPYLSTRVSRVTSTMQKERAPVVPFFLPLVHHSEGHYLKESGDIPFLRQDESVGYFNPYSKKRRANNGLIIGNTGYGKSVLFNLLINSIRKNKKNKILLVDVKTSHTSLTKNNEGLIHEFSIEKSSGMSAFILLEDSITKQTISYVCDFVINLCEGNDIFKDEDRSKISTEVNNYIKHYKQESNLIGFLEFSKNKNIPGYENLRRWGPEGVFGNVFKESKMIHRNDFQYFDLKSINDAGKGFFIKAVINSLMTEVYKKLSEKKEDERVYIIFDETPFFIKHCFAQLKDLAANIRSMGGVLILATQLSTDLIGPNGENSLFTLCHWKILMSHDGEESEYKKLTGVSDNNFNYLKNKKKESGMEARFFVLKEDDFEKRLGVRLTNKEYWESTSDSNDKAKIDLIIDNFNLDEVNARKAIEVISAYGR
jgi:hypothetical protein